MSKFQKNNFFCISIARLAVFFIFIRYNFVLPSTVATGLCRLPKNGCGLFIPVAQQKFSIFVCGCARPHDTSRPDLNCVGIFVVLLEGFAFFLCVCVECVLRGDLMTHSKLTYTRIYPTPTLFCFYRENIRFKTPHCPGGGVVDMFAQ